MWPSRFRPHPPTEYESGLRSHGVWSAARQTTHVHALHSMQIGNISSPCILRNKLHSRMASVQTSGFLITWRGIPEVVKMDDPRADDLVRQKRLFLSQRVASQHQVGLYVMLNVYYL